MSLKEQIAEYLATTLEETFENLPDIWEIDNKGIFKFILPSGEQTEINTSEFAQVVLDLVKERLEE